MKLLFWSSVKSDQYLVTCDLQCNVSIKDKLLYFNTAFCQRLFVWWIIHNSWQCIKSISGQRLLSTLTYRWRTTGQGVFLPGVFTLKIEAIELSFRDTKWDGLSTVFNILARKEVTVHRRKFVRASSTDLDCGSLKWINLVDPSDRHFW